VVVVVVVVQILVFAAHPFSSKWLFTLPTWSLMMWNSLLRYLI